MVAGEKKHGGVGLLGMIEVEEGPLREHKERRYRGSWRGPSRTRERGFADTDPGPRVTRPDGMRASGPREQTNREMDTPKIDRSVMVGRVARDEGSVGNNRRGGNGEEKLTKPEVRDDKKGFAGYHASEVRVMKSNRVNDAGKLVSS